MSEPDWNFVVHRLDAIERELREGLRAMELRREASHQAWKRSLAGLEAKLADMARRLGLSAAAS